MTTTTKKKCADKIPIVLAVLLVILSATVMSPSHAQEQSNVKQAVPYPLLRGPFVCDQREIQVGRATRGLSYGTYILTPLQTPALTPIERTAQMINVDLRMMNTTNSLAYQRYPMPVVVFAAGLMADILSVRRGGYITTLDALCSHGFVVVASRAGVEVTGQTLADGEDTPVDEHLLEIMLWLAGAKSSSTWGSFGNVSAHDYFQPYGGLDLDRVGLMGHSLGSAQAQRIAAATRGSGPAAHFFDGSMPRAKKINVRTLVMLGPVCGALQDCCFTSQRCGNPRWARAGKNRISMLDEETGCSPFLCSSDPTTPHRTSVPYLLTTTHDYEAYDGSLLVVVGTEDKRAHPFAGLEVWRHAPNASTRALAMLRGGTHCFVDMNPFALAFREVNECGYNVLSWTDQLMHTQQLVNSWFLTYLAKYPQPIAMRYLDSLPNRRLSRPQEEIQNSIVAETPTIRNADRPYFDSIVERYRKRREETAAAARAENSRLPPPERWEEDVCNYHNDDIDMRSLVFEGAALSMLYGDTGLWRSSSHLPRRTTEAQSFSAMAMLDGGAAYIYSKSLAIPSNMLTSDRNSTDVHREMAKYYAGSRESVMRGVDSTRRG